MTHVTEGETTRGRNDSGRKGKWAKRPVTVLEITHFYCMLVTDISIDLHFILRIKIKEQGKTGFMFFKMIFRDFSNIDHESCRDLRQLP